MNNPLFLILIFIIFFFLAMLFMIWFMNFVIRKAIGEKHLYMDEITGTGNIPKTWSKRFDNKINRLKAIGENNERIKKIHRSASKSYIRRLNKLVHYVEKTRLVEDEDTRTVILADLYKVRSKWEVKDIT